MASGDVVFETTAASVSEESTDFVDTSAGSDPRSQHRAVLTFGDVTVPGGVDNMKVTLEYRLDVGSDSANRWQAGETPFDASRKYKIKITEA